MSDTDELPVLAEATRYLFGNLLLVREADLSAPTPCPDWDLRRLLWHVRSSLADVADVLLAGDPDRGSERVPAEGDPSDPVAALRVAIIDLLLVSNTAPAAGLWCEIYGRALPSKTVVYVGAIEMVLHAWDIAQACRTDRPIPSDVASALLCVSPPLAQAGRAGGVFAAPLASPATATPSEQLLALFGRRASRR
ncbi:TIGR03086 family metal-binding protein [Mycobacterium sp. 1245805.9]|uniref:TIGR03086 family metal-binding protein n=1 Tax=Mycobacterium sp. 1245805.9 TaxID=1856862 RepID=UPI0007FB83BF|nr:TIGR03086 family metal-binding protein [Mycobacterium sp. 1245805.9]OBI94271.1 TIGR03086 family protein [Mycobacterium sp. 1245805.9]